ncbi:MAG: DUF4198 domain-containing protein [Bacillota bacterium]
MDRKGFFIHDTTLRMYYGHEGWLEPARNNYQVGERANVCFKWGHNMEVDGICSLERLQAWLTDPALQKKPCTLLPGDGLYYELSLRGEGAGFYQLLVQHDGMLSITADGSHALGSRREHPSALEALAFTQYSKCLLKFGEAGAIPPFAKTNLDLLPLDWEGLKMGTPAVFQVFFKDKALEQGEVTFARSGKEGSPRIDVVELGKDGKITVTPDLEGNYLLLVRHKDETDREEGVYDKRSYTCVFSFTL